MVAVARAGQTHARCDRRQTAYFLVLGLLGGCSLILDFDEPAETPVDAPVSSAACAASEPNDEPATAVAIATGEVAAAICEPGESDYFTFTVDGDQATTLRLTFANRQGAGDLDLSLLSGDGETTIAESRTSNDVEEVLCPGSASCPDALPAGDYLVHVFGFNSTVQAEYTLQLDLEALPSARPR